MKYLIPVLLIAVSFYSCSKKDGDPGIQAPIEGSYVSSNTVQFQSIRMFTMNGEVTNTQVINNFVSLKKLENVFKLSRQTVKQEIDFSIVINNDKTVEVKNESNITKGSLTQYDGNINKITGEILNEGPPVVSGSICSDIINIKDLLLFNHSVNCLNIPSSNGVFERCNYLQGFFLVTETPKQIYLPIQTFRISNYTSYMGQPSQCLYTSTNEWNLINPTSYKNLRANDTLVFQERRLLLTKK